VLVARKHAASTVVVALAIACGAIGLLAEAGRSKAAPAGVIECTRAVMVDGFLRCDEEAPHDVALLCEGGGLRSSEALEAGDAVDTERLCAHDEVLRGRAEHGWTRMDPGDLKLLAQPVDVNHASAEELASLPGVGPAVAGRIVEGRPYETVDDLQRVSGIGPVKLERLRTRARVD